MAQTICYEVFPNNKNLKKMRASLVGKHGFKEKENHIGPYFYIEVDPIDSWMIRSLLRWRRYKFRRFDKRYERSSTYRKVYFENNKGPYHCSYCGKKVTPSTLEVDHLIPVAKAKTKLSVRILLFICGITNVNDPKNLVSSCEKCNRKKSDKMFGWVLRGSLGRHKIFWVLRNIAIIIALIVFWLIFFNNPTAITFIEKIIASVQ